MLTKFFLSLFFSVRGCKRGLPHNWIYSSNDFIHLSKHNHSKGRTGTTINHARSDRILHRCSMRSGIVQTLCAPPLGATRFAMKPTKSSSM